ncbi:hypothetical protein NL676_026003 [Syzygium grande]|nr:hypothetical protein NL676_026003 [Syzygium grande]
MSIEPRSAAVTPPRRNAEHFQQRNQLSSGPLIRTLAIRIPTSKCPPFTLEPDPQNRENTQNRAPASQIRVRFEGTTHLKSPQSRGELSRTLQSPGVTRGMQPTVSPDSRVPGSQNPSRRRRRRR